MRRILNDIPMLGLGSGIAMAGASLAVIGVNHVKKDWYAGGVAMMLGVGASHIGVQVAVGAVERMRGLR
jgi:hypothetical protein